MRTVAQRHEGEQRPFIIHGWVSAFLSTYPSLHFGAPGPLLLIRLLVPPLGLEVATYRAWWKSTMQTSGSRAAMVLPCLL